MSLEYKHQGYSTLMYKRLDIERFEEALKKLKETKDKEIGIVLHTQRFEDEVTKEIKNMINKEII